MSESGAPLSVKERSVLSALMPSEPPADAEARVFARLASSIAVVPAPTPTPAVKAFGAKVVVTIATVSLGTGLALGTWAGRTMFAAPPVVVERVKFVERPSPSPTEAPVQLEPPVSPGVVPPEVVTPAPKRRATATVPAPAPAPIDGALAKERELVDTARSALLHGNAEGALASLRRHEVEFATGRLAEERESLWVQALVLSGAIDAARERAQRFHATYPHSLLGPTVDAALAP